jgi:hypothetical protein
MPVNPALAELARLFARGYVRQLAARADQGVFPYPENDAVSLPNPLDVVRPQWPPCAAPEARRT